MPLTVGNYLAGPLIAFAVIGLLAAVLRWTFGRAGGYPAPHSPLDPTAEWISTSGATAVGPDADPAAAPVVEPAPSTVEPAPSTVDTPGDDYGLLQPVAELPDAVRADVVRDRLQLAGIRATVAAGTDGRYRVLVFDSEVGRARGIAG